MRFEGLIPDKGMFVDFSDSKLVIDLKKAGDSVKASYCLHAAFNVYTDAAAGCNEACPHTKSAKIGAPRRYYLVRHEAVSLCQGVDTAVFLFCLSSISAKLGEVN